MNLQLLNNQQKKRREDLLTNIKSKTAKKEEKDSKDINNSSKLKDLIPEKERISLRSLVTLNHQLTHQAHQLIKEHLVEGITRATITSHLADPTVRVVDTIQSMTRNMMTTRVATNIAALTMRNIEEAVLQAKDLIIQAQKTIMKAAESMREEVMNGVGMTGKNMIQGIHIINTRVKDIITQVSMIRSTHQGVTTIQRRYMVAPEMITNQLAISEITVSMMIEIMDQAESMLKGAEVEVDTIKIKF